MPKMATDAVDVEVDASAVSSPNALRENIAKKGSSSYYYAHANTTAEVIKTTLGDAVSKARHAPQLAPLQRVRRAFGTRVQS